MKERKLCTLPTLMNLVTTDIQTRLQSYSSSIDGQIEFSQILNGLPFLHNLTIVCRL